MMDKVAHLFDISRAKARSFLDRLDDPKAWAAGPMAGSWLMFLDGGGARVAGATLAFVKLDAGLDWPEHRHLGREDMLVLAGGFREPSGFEVHPGQTHVMEAGTQHSFRIFDDEPCISAVVLFEGVEFLTPGMEIDLGKR
jgi:anti-sigma factor ChrR (cupin superfamily)